MAETVKNDSSAKVLLTSRLLLHIGIFQVSTLPIYFWTTKRPSLFPTALLPTSFTISSRRSMHMIPSRTKNEMQNKQRHTFRELLQQRKLKGIYEGWGGGTDKGRNVC